METIKSKKVLHSKIKDILESDPDDGLVFPKEFNFCQGVGEPVFSFKVEKIEHDFFIDEKGQKWVKAQ